MPGPLEGYRIIDVCRAGPGRMATGILADYGADVVSIVEPGYAQRSAPGTGAARASDVMNQRNKRSLFLNFRAEGAREVFLSLAKRSDAVLESNRPGVVKRLGARKMETVQVPVVYDTRVSGGLVRHLAGAINGVAVARGTSFLKDKMGERIFPAGIVIVDDPHRKRGLRSKPFDGEGIATARKIVIEDGRLATWLLDLASARSQVDDLCSSFLTNPVIEDAVVTVTEDDGAG